MANLNETDVWAGGIYQLEEDDPVLGGPTGIDNLAPRQLASRTLYQRLRNVTPWDATLPYPANVAYVSYGGSTWKSVGESINVAPGTDAAKWVRWAFTEAELALKLGDAVSVHEAKLDPHPQYASDADFAAHLAAADPHSQYVRHDAAQALTGAQATQARTNIAAELAGTALSEIQKNSARYGVDTGPANAAAVVFAPAITALTDGMVLVFAAAVGNTGPATLAVNALAAKTIVGVALAPLQGGEIVAGGKCLVIWSTPLDKFILIECTGGAKQVAPASASQHVPQFGQVQGGPSVRGLIAKNNAATPASQFDIAASSVTLCNPATGGCKFLPAPANLTVNALTAGPAANGRDQAAAFANNTWLYMYYMWNGVTLATIVSAVPPPVGPTLPNGYTHWAYVGAVYWTTSFANIRIRGSWTNYVVSPSVVAGGTSTTVAAVSLTSLVPPNAMEFKLYVPNLGISSNGSGAFGVTCAIQVEAGATPWQCGLQGVAAASQPQFISGGFTTLANVSQGINYQLQITSGAGPTVTIGLQGYSNPNGA